MRTSLLNLDPALESSAPWASLGQVQAQASHGVAASQSIAPAASQPLTQPATQPPQTAAGAAAAAPSPTLKSYENDGVDFEIVFGRRQVASTGLVLIVALASFSGLSYLIGKAVGSKAFSPAVLAPAAAVPAVAAPAATVVSPPVAAAPPVTTKVSSPASEVTRDTPKSQPPVFAEAIPGKVYIQVGALEKGLAGVWAEGLRTHGLPSFVAAGPTDKMWRVLVGPLGDPAAYQVAKETLDKLGIATFGKKYPDSPAH